VKPGRSIVAAFDAAALACVRVFLPALPREAARLAGALFGAMALLVSPERRKRSLENLRRVLPHRGAGELRRIRRRCFIQFGAGFAEVFHLHHKTRSYLRRIVGVEGLPHLAGALQKGKGAIVIGGHLSTFPVGMLALAGEGFPVAALVRAADNRKVEAMVNDIRRAFGLSWIYVKPRREAARRCMRWLAEGKVLWILIDQRHRDGIVADFLGHPAQVAPGAALFALRAGPPVLPVVTLRSQNSHYRVVIGKEVPVVSTGTRELDLRTNMEHFLAVLGRYILEYPHQWTWFHKMWKVREAALPR
jgi:KDO2-lipid IV(A) lauroyltransferase